MNWALALIIASILQVAASPASGATLYVNAATGNDSVARTANTAATPWKTIGRAAWGSTNRDAPNPAEAAQAGDTVVVAAGTYDQAAQGKARTTPLYNPANDGAAGNPLTFRADGRVVLESTTYNGPVIGTLGRDHIVWDGFYIDEADVNFTSDTGPVVVWDSEYVTIQNLEIKGTYAPYVDNHPGIRLEAANHVTVRGNLVYGFGVTRNGQTERSRNSSCIQLYYSNHIVIEHNELRECGSGIFVKGIRPPSTMDDVVVRFNHIYDMGAGEGPSASGIILQSVTNAKVYQNVIRDSDVAIEIEAMARPQDLPVNVIIANNTLHNFTDAAFRMRALAPIWKNVRVLNNLTSKSPVLWAEDIDDLGDVQFEHNNYMSASGRFATLRRRQYSFGDWKKALSQDSAVPASTTSLLRRQVMSPSSTGRASYSPAHGVWTKSLPHG